MPQDDLLLRMLEHPNQSEHKELPPNFAPSNAVSVKGNVAEISIKIESIQLIIALVLLSLFFALHLLVWRLGRLVVVLQILALLRRLLDSSALRASPLATGCSWRSSTRAGTLLDLVDDARRDG